jgi:hypothetical protein
VIRFAFVSRAVLPREPSLLIKELSEELFEERRGLLSLQRVDPAEGVVVHRFTAEIAVDAPANAMPIKNRHHRQKIWGPESWIWSGPSTRILAADCLRSTA